MIELPRKKESGSNKFPLLILLIGGAIMFVDATLARIGGLIVILLGMVSMYLRSGVQLDLTIHQYRKYMKLGWMYFGKWQPLPETEYVAIVRMRLSQIKFTPSQASFTQDDSGFLHNYNINLIFRNSTLRYLTIYTGDIDDTMPLAKTMAREMQTQLYDCSTSQKKWVSVDELKG